MSSSKILPEVREVYEAVEKFQLVSSYGIQHRMIPPAGRPEIIIEGSLDKKTWTVRASLGFQLAGEEQQACRPFAF